MPPGKSSRNSNLPKKSIKLVEEGEEVLIEAESSVQDEKLPISIEYFEFHDGDLKTQEKETGEAEQLKSITKSETVKNVNTAQRSFSRKIKLLIRRTYLLCELSSFLFFIEHHLNNELLSGVVLSFVPPHILRIFDPVMILEGKTLKNSVAMLATWWKNNIGLRMLPSNKTSSRFSSVVRSASSKIVELKASILSKSAYEDDSVKLFLIVCNGLGIKIRLVHSLDMISATSTKSHLESQSFQFIPRYWIEIYSVMDDSWISVDCIQGLVDEKTRLESKSNPHSFVIAIDGEGLMYDLTEKYAQFYEEKSFKLRKDEDKWFVSLIQDINSRNLNFGTLKEKIEIPAEDIEMPKTLSAIKNHPKLILESQLKKYEVFYPVTKPVGFFKDEAVFLRNNIKKVRSKDAWLSQCARIVKANESPIKLVNLPRKGGAPENEPTGVQPLYGEWQTNPYIPPEVVDGKVPRNDHGNIDLFQPSMLPNKCVHITLPGAWKVARYLKIDYADACIGFSFHGGRALPAIHGIVITEKNFEVFDSEYKTKLIESFRNDATDLEKQIAQKWIKIFKNAMIAKRLKTDSSVSFSESLISCGSSVVENSSEALDEKSIITFAASSKPNIEPEIEEFDEI